MPRVQIIRLVIETFIHGQSKFALVRHSLNCENNEECAPGHVHCCSVVVLKPNANYEHALSPILEKREQESTTNMGRFLLPHHESASERALSYTAATFREFEQGDMK